MNNKCVYLLRDKDDVVRYVGQGSIDRPYKKYGRSEEFKNILKCGGYLQIFAKNLNRDSVLYIEHKLIEYHKNTLINQKSSPQPRRLLFSELNEVFLLDNNSPSGISAKVDRYLCTRELSTKAMEPVGAFNSKDVAVGWNVSFKGRATKCHRIVWVLSTKQDLVNPDMVINHIDGNPLNNSLSNLELVTQRTNCIKKTKFPQNSTGVVGIKLEIPKAGGRSPAYRVSISPVKGKRINKNFAISVHGLLPAFALAVKWRETKIKELVAANNY